MNPQGPRGGSLKRTPSVVASRLADATAIPTWQFKALAQRDQLDVVGLDQSVDGGKTGRLNFVTLSAMLIPTFFLPPVRISGWGSM